MVTTLKDRLKTLLYTKAMRFRRSRGSPELTLGEGVRHYVPPGHYYSPVPSLDEVKADERSIFDNIPRNLPGITLNEREQLLLLEELKDYYKQLPFHPGRTPGLRYFFENPSYSYSDAVFLYCMIRHLKPRRIIEVGSGYSSCVMLDTNELHFDGTIALTFIDPNPQLLLSLISDTDKEKVRILSSRIQDVELEEFESLEANDILFIDSSHVSKVHSDVNRIFFDILPRLNEGVFIHLHDIFYPFEYPKEWIYEGRAWTEAYLLRAFLMYNKSFRIVVMNTFLERYYESVFRQDMPLCLRNPGGSIWICTA